jgi:CheY-like chemotaxis protein
MSVHGMIRARRSEHSRRVLCVDDAHPALELLGQILELSGYEVTTSTSSVQTAQTFVGGDFDLAVLDYDMPAINGAELAVWLKTASPELKVILYTGAMWVPKHELHSVDLMVHKSEGIPALLSALETFLPFRRLHASERASGGQSYSNLKKE